MENDEIKGTIKCGECGAEYEEETNFCTNCGNPIEEYEESHTVSLNCPQCGALLGAQDSFCRECGNKIEVINICPQCQSPIKPGDKFCTECGVNVYDFEPPSPSSAKKDPVEEFKNTGDDILKDVEKAGRGLMKDVGSFLDKSSQGNSKKKIKPVRKDQRYLVCDKCLGYYKLKPGENPEDFSDECECGGNLECRNSPPV